MHFIKRLVLFCFSAAVVSACFDQPEFSNKPRIEFKDIKFKKGEGQTEKLILTIDFKDGDGDIGLSSEGEDFPYNNEFFYLHDGTGDTIPIIAETVDQAGIIYTILDAGPTVEGKLVTTRTRLLPNYGYLPAYDPNYSCVNYKTISSIQFPGGPPISGFLVPFSFVDPSYTIDDTLTVSGKQYALVKDRLLYKRNLNAFNIEVRFWQFENGGYVEYDWFKFNTCNDFFGRFKTSITDVVAGEPIDGSLEYTMESDAFQLTFGSREIKVTVRIRDRALNTSNTVESSPFELNEILVD